MPDCLFCKTDLVEHPSYIAQFEKWTLLANFKQPTLGSALLVLNRHKDFLGKITLKEWRNYAQIVKRLENTYRELWQPDAVNHLMLANTEPHIHFHVVPRYKHPRTLGGIEFRDPNYGTAPHLKTDEIPRALLEKVVKEIFFNFK